MLILNHQLGIKIYDSLSVQHSMHATGYMEVDPFLSLGPYGQRVVDKWIVK